MPQIRMMDIGNEGYVDFMTAPQLWPSPIPSFKYHGICRLPAFTLGIEAHGVDGCIPGPEAAAV